MSKRARNSITTRISSWFAAISKFIVGTRPVRWVSRQRVTRLVVAIIQALADFSEWRVWRPAMRMLRRIRRFLGRRELFAWMFTWLVCACIAWTILSDPIWFRLLGGILAVIGFTFVCFRSPLVGLAAWVFLLPLMNALIRVRLLENMPAVTVDRICAVILLFVWVAYMRRESKSAPNWFLHTCMALFVIGMLISALPHEKPKWAFGQVINIHGVPMFAYVFARRWVTSTRALSLAIAAIVGVGFYFCAIGIPEHFIGRTLLAYTNPIWVEAELRTVRVQGPAETPQEFGIAVAAALVLAVAGISTDRNKRRRLIYGVIISLSVLGIALTLRRSVYVGALIGLLVMLLGTRKTRRTAMAMLAVGGIVLLISWQSLLSSKVYSERLSDKLPLYSRAVVQATAWNIIKSKPIFGVGFDNFAAAKQQFVVPYKGISTLYAKGIESPHSSYLRVLVEGGLVAFLPFVGVVLGAIITSIRIYKRVPEPGLLGRDGVVAFWALSAALLTQAMSTDASLHSRYLMTVWLFFIGALAGVHLQKEAAAEETSSVPVKADAKTVSFRHIPRRELS